MKPLMQPKETLNEMLKIEIRHKTGTETLKSP